MFSAIRRAAPGASVSVRALALAIAFAPAALLTACGGGSGSSGPTAPSVLFATDTSTSTVVAFTTKAPTPGTMLLGLELATGSAGGNAIAYDSGRDLLYVANTNWSTGAPSSTLSVYAHASTATSLSTPLHTITVPSWVDRGIPHIVLDKAHDRLYVATNTANTQGHILVYENASTTQGAGAPWSMGSDVRDFAIDTTRSMMYFTDWIQGVEGCSFDTTQQLVTGCWNVAGNNAIMDSGVAVDEVRDRLYIASVFQGLYIVDQASTHPASATAHLARPLPSTPTVDAASDRLYLSTGPDVYVIEQASTLVSNSTVPAAAIANSGAVVGHLAF